ncbi:MAG: hypothetical protein WAU17_08165, partial [Nitrospirales bacterium]
MSIAMVVSKNNPEEKVEFNIPSVARWGDNLFPNGDMLRPIKTIDSILDELENFVSQNPHSKAIAEARLARIFSSTAAPSKVTQETTITGKRPWSKEMKITKAEGRRNPATFVKEVYEAEIMN